MGSIEWRLGPTGWTYAQCPRAENTVYRFMVGDEVLYVGRAKFLWKRMRTHRKSMVAVFAGAPFNERHAGRYAPILSAANEARGIVVTYETFATWGEAMTREIELINELDPTANVQKSRR